MEETIAKVLDLSVNMGPKQAHTLVQRALQATHHRVAVDGVLGPQTFGAIDEVPAIALCPAIRSEAAGFYRLLAAQRPELSKFLRGWLRRAYH